MPTMPTVDIADRESLIRWLVWNDPNGCYTDEECIGELGAPATLATLQECYHSQME